MEYFRREVELVSTEGTTTHGHFVIWDEDPDHPENTNISLSFDKENLEASAEDLFSALCSIRLDLEKRGLVPHCYGASRNVYPSGMSRGMGVGDKAYKLSPGQPARNADIVDIFESGPDIDAVSVNVQKSFFDEWLQSLK